MTSRQKYAGAPWLYDETTGDIVGVKDPDGSEFYWSRAARIGSFYDTTDQTNSANTAKVVTINTTDISRGVSIVSGSRITVDRAGVYNIQFSAQFENSDVSDQDVSLWFKKNGVDIDQSNTFLFHAATTWPGVPPCGCGMELLGVNECFRLCRNVLVNHAYWNVNPGYFSADQSNAPSHAVSDLDGG